MKMEPSNNRKRNLKLVVVTSEPIYAYERAGYGSWLREYYNPCGFFDEVYALSPKESGEREAHGMKIIGIDSKDFTGWVNKLRPNVVRAYGGFWPSDLVCGYRIKDVPVIVSVHDTIPELIHKSVVHADLIVCMTRAVADRVEARGADPRKIRILPNRVNPTVFYPRKDQEFKREFGKRFPVKYPLLHVGRKTEQKNIETVIAALSHLPEDYGCVFVGQGDSTPYKASAVSLGVSNRCFWVDAVPNSELPLWYSAAACMCTPSLWEGFGIVFIEASACGAPIITSNIAPMNEYLKHEKSAYLVSNYQDPAMLAAGVKRVCEDSEFRTQLSLGALEVAKSFFKDEIDRQEVAIYEEALKIKVGSNRKLVESYLLRLEVEAKEKFQKSYLRKLLSFGKKTLIRDGWRGSHHEKQ